MPDDAAAAMMAGRSQGGDGALEAVENMLIPGHDDLKGLVVFIAAKFTLVHILFSLTQTMCGRVALPATLSIETRPLHRLIPTIAMCQRSLHRFRMEHFVQNDCGGDRDIERIAAAAHWNPHDEIA